MNYLGSAFIWNQVFTDEEVEADLAFVLERLKLLDHDDRARLHAVAPFLTLYVITLLHGSAIRFDKLGHAELFATYRNDQQRLEVKATLIITDIGKPMIAPVCIFWTGLSAADWCDSLLLDGQEEWDGPLEINQAGLFGRNALTVPVEGKVFPCVQAFVSADPFCGAAPRNAPRE